MPSGSMLNKKIKVAINLWILKNSNTEGIGWFTYYTTKYLIAQHPEVEFHFFTAKNFSIQELYVSNVKVHPIFPNKRHPVLYILYLHYILPFYLKRIKPDVFLSPDGMLSLHTTTKQLSVIHDINFVHYPNDSKWYNSWYYNRYFPKYAHIADRLATVSNYSRDDIATTFHVSLDKIDVVYNGLNDHFGSEVISDEDKVISFDIPYFVFVGSINPRKNIGRLIQAFDEIRKTGRVAKLVIAGAKGWLLKDVQDALENSNYKDDIIFTGRLTNEALKQVLSKALALVFIPYFEGFGLPILEAMACNVPVISSNVTSLPEVAGDAALYVDPYNIHSISDAMIKMFDNIDLRSTLQMKGKEQAKKFSWKKASERLWDSIEKILNC